jgi:NAD(P)-dependent dehydrogenase (short-subunit alcohol dehydrogenase family)
VSALDGQQVVITGGNSGIGLETAVALARAGARVVITARDPARGADAVAEIRTRSGGDVDVMALDLASFASVRAFAAEILATRDRLDILVNNAGAILNDRRVTVDGHEAQFQTNHLGHFLLTDLLRERLVADAPSRVVVVASDAHRFAARGLNWDDLESTRRYFGFRTYSRTKLMNILFVRELSRRLDGTGVTANAVHPGFVASRFSRDGDTGFMGNVGMVLGRPFAISPEKGARTSVYVASAPDLVGVSGQYFAKSRLAQPSSAARDDAAARRLWDVSAELTGATAD